MMSCASGNDQIWKYVFSGILRHNGDTTKGIDRLTPEESEIEEVSQYFKILQNHLLRMV